MISRSNPEDGFLLLISVLEGIILISCPASFWRIVRDGHLLWPKFNWKNGNPGFQFLMYRLQIHFRTTNFLYETQVRCFNFTQN